MKTKLENLIYQINNLSESDLVALNNAYCQSANYPDDEIYSNDEEFFELYFSKAEEAVRAAHYGSYNYTDAYVQFNGYGNLVSYSSINSDNLVDTVSVIAGYALENENDFYMLNFEVLEDLPEEDLEDLPE